MSMASNFCKFRIVILMLALCSAVYVATRPLKYGTKERRRESHITLGKSLDRSSMESRDEILHMNTKVSSKSGPLVNNSASQMVASNEEEEDDLHDDQDNDTLVYDCSDEVEQLEESKHSVYGKPVYATNKTIMYMSMPKCGSRTFVWTSSMLRGVRHFGNMVNVEYILEDNPPLKMRDLIDARLRDAEAGAIIHGHYRFIDMYGSPKKPILMSMIRDPIERFESHFYFMRKGDQDMPKEELIKRLGPNTALPNETLDDCIEKDRSDCTSSLFRNLYVTSFCGYDPRCSESAAFALSQAKLNVDKFLAIGVMEEYDLSMAVFEKLLPQTFGGATKMYSESKNKSMERSKTNYKKAPSQKTYSILKTRMKYDYAFYEYVKKRMHRVARRLAIGSCSTNVS